MEAFKDYVNKYALFGRAINVNYGFTFVIKETQENKEYFRGV